GAYRTAAAHRVRRNGVERVPSAADARPRYFAGSVRSAARGVRSAVADKNRRDRRRRRVAGLAVRAGTPARSTRPVPERVREAHRGAGAANPVCAAGVFHTAARSDRPAHGEAIGDAKLSSLTWVSLLITGGGRSSS